MIRLGFVGAGLVSQICHLPSFHDDKRIKFIAISDKDRDILKKVAKKYSIPNKFINYKNMLEKCKLDAVILAANRNTIEDISRYILKKKINLFVEKPQCYSTSVADELIRISEKNKVKYTVGYMKKYDNGIIFLKKYLTQKRIGSIKSIYYENFLGDSYENPFEYFRTEKKRNKRLNDLSVKNKFLNNFSHNINLLEYLFGKLKYLKNNFFDDRIGSGLLFFENRSIKIILNCMYSKSKKWHEEMHINLQKEKIIVKFPTPLKKNTSASIIIKNYKNGNELVPFIEPGWSFRNQAKFFVNSIYNKKQKKNINEAKYNYNTLSIVEEIFNK
jgi:predicted dehydrogenase